MYTNIYSYTNHIMGHSASSALFEESTANKMNISITASLPDRISSVKFDQRIGEAREVLRTGTEGSSEPPKVVLGCESPDEFGRRRFEQMGLIPLHQLDWVKNTPVEDTSECGIRSVTEDIHCLLYTSPSPRD